MDSIGAEVGQKMRSAIKAKLLELNCYVDDELPDYVMVMVANKRSKSQMNEDLQLFLSTKTSTFVDWLHIVLKKLKEVTVTNPEVYKKVAKRKSSELPDVKVKREKKEKECNSSKTKKSHATDEDTKSLTDNLLMNTNKLSEQRKITIVNESKHADGSFDDTFDIPLLSEVNMSSEKDLQEIEKKIKSVKSRLGLLVESDIEEELPEFKTEKDVLDLKNKASKNSKRTVQCREESLSEYDNKESGTNSSQTVETSKPTTETNTSPGKKLEHKRITFEKDVSPPKRSVLERLGKKSESITNSERIRFSLSEFRSDRKEEKQFTHYSRNYDEPKDKQTERDWRHRRERKIDKARRDKDSRRATSRERRRDRDESRDRRRDRSGSRNKSDLWKEDILGRLGVMSKVSLPPREPEAPEPEDELKTREVRSMVQVKPRIIPSGTPQPNKNLLLKAVAEAQKSVAQTPNVGSHLMSELYTSKHTEYSKEKSPEEVPFYRKFSQSEKTKLRNLILAQAAHRSKQEAGDGNKVEEEYIPKPIKSFPKETPNYIPSSRQQEEGSDLESNGETSHQFVVTLDGMEKSKSVNSEEKQSIKSRLDQKALPSVTAKPSIKSRLDGRRSPSPIIFDKVTTKINAKSNIPDKLPIVHPPLSVKNKERCKYWPNCRQGDKCEFVHPIGNCEMFPHCKFGDKCLYLHPACKFGSSCTKRECPYSHTIVAKSAASRLSLVGIPAKMAVAGLQTTCKFFPNCTNISCPFYHPKACKFGKYCKNQSECSFSHVFISNKSSLIWRSH